MMIGGMRIAHNNAVIKTAPGIEKLGEECKFQEKIWPVLQSTGGRSCLATCSREILMEFWSPPRNFDLIPHILKEW